MSAQTDTPSPPQATPDAPPLPTEATRAVSADEQLYDSETEGPLDDVHSVAEQSVYEHNHNPDDDEFRLIPHHNAPDHLKLYMPILYWLPKYQWKEWFPSDAIAAVTCVVMAIPQCLGYALVANLEPIYGLYSSLMGNCLYGPFATCGQSAVGPLAIVSLMTRETLQPYVSDLDPLDDNTSKIEAAYASALSFQVGIICLLAGLCRAGVLANLLAQPVIVGFTFASAILIAFSQFTFITDIKVDGPYRFIQFLMNIGDAHVLSVILALICIIFLLIMRTWKRSQTLPYAKYIKFVPSELILVVITTLLSSSLGDSTGWDIVGYLPNGLPNAVLFFNYVDNNDFWSMWVASILIALVGYLQLIAVAVKFASSRDYSIDASQELIALGICNLIGCWFQIFPIAGVISLSTVIEAAGATTPLYTIISGFFMIITNLFLLSIFEWLPKPVLGSIVLVGILNLFDIPTMKQIYQINRKDFLCMLITILATLLIGIDQGVALGVATSVLLVTQSAAKPHYGVLVRLPNENVAVYRNIKHHDDLQTNKDMLMIRWDASIFFANAQSFKQRIRKQIGRHLELHDYPIKWCLALCFSGVNDIDYTGADAIKSLFDELLMKEKGMTLLLCKCKPHVLKTLEKAGVIDSIGKDHVLWNMHKAEVWWQEYCQNGHVSSDSNISVEPITTTNDITRLRVASNSLLVHNREDLKNIVEEGHQQSDSDSASERDALK